MVFPPNYAYSKGIDILNDFKNKWLLPPNVSCQQVKQLLMDQKGSNNKSLFTSFFETKLKQMKQRRVKVGKLQILKFGT